MKVPCIAEKVLPSVRQEEERDTCFRNVALLLQTTTTKSKKPLSPVLYEVYFSVISLEIILLERRTGSWRK